LLVDGVLSGATGGDKSTALPGGEDIYAEGRGGWRAEDPLSTEGSAEVAREAGIDDEEELLGGDSTE
jgi:hypothetical protein